MSSPFGAGKTPAVVGERIEFREEFPTIREQDLAIILADWVRMKAKQPPPSSPGEIDALDFTVIAADLSRGLHPQSLAVIIDAIPHTPQWEHLRARLRVQLQVRQSEEFVDYSDRVMPVH